MSSIMLESESQVSEGTKSTPLPDESILSEALARGEYLIENGRQFGLLLGKQGSGKTAVLEYFSNQIRRPDRVVALYGLSKISPREFLNQLANDLGVRPEFGPQACGASDVNADPSVLDPNGVCLWSRIEDRLAANGLEQRTTVLLVDDLDHADSETLEQLTRLVTIFHTPARYLTLFGSVNPVHVGQIPSRLLDSLSLRIDLDS